MHGQNIAALALGFGLFLFGVVPILGRSKVTAWNNRVTAKWHANGRWPQADGTSPGQRMTSPMVVALGLMIGLMGLVLVVMALTVNMAGSDHLPRWAPKLIGAAFAAPFVAAVLYFKHKDKSSGSR